MQSGLNMSLFVMMFIAIFCFHSYNLYYDKVMMIFLELCPHLISDIIFLWVSDCFIRVYFKSM